MKNYLVKIIGADRKVIDFFNVEMTTDQVKQSKKNRSLSLNSQNKKLDSDNSMISG